MKFDKIFVSQSIMDFDIVEFSLRDKFFSNLE